MEHIEGQPVDVQNPDHLDALKRALGHLKDFRRSFPGPLHHVEPQGILWEDNRPSKCDTIEGLQTWMNEWQSNPVDLADEELVLCHLDTALENMLWLPSGQICLLDWASAGFYPRYFETAAHLKKGRPDQAVELILQSPTSPFSDLEKSHMQSQLHACRNAMMYARPTPKIPRPSMERQYLRKQPSIPQM